MSALTMPRIRKKSNWNGPFGKQIEALMRELDIERLEDFAELAELGATTVYNLVHGRTTPTGETVTPSIDTPVKLAVALDAPLHDLLYQLVPEAVPRETEETSAHQATRIEICNVLLTTRNLEGHADAVSVLRLEEGVEIVGRVLRVVHDNTY
jgi:transcriptional regulator with XRE-family HTH domain